MLRFVVEVLQLLLLFLLPTPVVMVEGAAGAAEAAVKAAVTATLFLRCSEASEEGGCATLALARCKGVKVGMELSLLLPLPLPLPVAPPPRIILWIEGLDVVVAGVTGEGNGGGVFGGGRPPGACVC